MTNKPQYSDIIFYTSPAGNMQVEVVYNDETFWLSKKRMAELFGVDVRTVNEHLQNVYNTKELDREATVRKFRIVRKEGSHDVAKKLAEKEYDKFRIVQDKNFESDFDKGVKTLINKEKPVTGKRKNKS